MEVKIYSTDMSDEERKKWKNPEDICPACNKKFGGWKQVKVCDFFPHPDFKDDTIIHKKCVEHN